MSESGPIRRPRVYVVQNTMKINKYSGKFEAKFDLSKAEEWGDLVFLLQPATESPRYRHGSAESLAESIQGGVVAELHKKLKHIEDGDFILPIGNPTLIAFAVAIATDYMGGSIRILQWNRDRYFEVTAELFPDDDLE